MSVNFAGVVSKNEGFNLNELDLRYINTNEIEGLQDYKKNVDLTHRILLAHKVEAERILGLINANKIECDRRVRSLTEECERLLVLINANKLRSDIIVALINANKPENEKLALLTSGVKSLYAYIPKLSSAHEYKELGFDVVDFGGLASNNKWDFLLGGSWVGSWMPSFFQISPETNPLDRSLNRIFQRLRNQNKAPRIIEREKDIKIISEEGGVHKLILNPIIELEIVLPEKIKIWKFGIMGAKSTGNGVGAGAKNQPSDFSIHGSNDGITFDKIADIENALLLPTRMKYFEVFHREKFSRFMLRVTLATSGTTQVVISGFQLYPVLDYSLI